MEVLNREDLKEEHNYCPHCGGLVDFKSAMVKLCAPPIYVYLCKDCNKPAVKVRG